MTQEYEKCLEALKEAINSSKKITFLTGAGVSTNSGIPDYRSANGIYSENPETMLSRFYKDNCYYAFMDFIRNKFDFRNAKPNNIHRWIASLEADHDVTVITQNVDSLHEDAGSTNVIHFHGDIKQWKCLSCGKIHDFDYIKANSYCDCEDEGKLEASIVLYGDNIDQENDRLAREALWNSNLVIVVGTSLSVFPFAGLIEELNPYFVEDVATLVLLNKEDTTYYSNAFDIKIIDDASNVVNELEEI